MVDRAWRAIWDMLAYYNKDGRDPNNLLGTVMLEMNYENLTLILDGIYPADFSKNFCPTHTFKMYVNNINVGILNFRLGQSKHICTYAGHIGFSVNEEFRGNRYASKALKAVLPHCFQYYPKLFLTCDIDNIPCIKTIESVNNKYVGIVLIPKNNYLYKSGHRKKRLYELPSK